MRNSRTILITVAIILAILAFCCLCVFGISAVTLIHPHPQNSSGPPIPTPFLPTTTQESSLTPTASSIPANTAVFTGTLMELENTIIPVHDRIDLAHRLKGIENPPRSLKFPVKIYQINDQETFWVNNSDTNEYFQVKATLRYVTDHVYFWIQNDEEYSGSDMKALVDTFEEKIYPKNREFFGSEWTPGVDADPHLFILYVRGLGRSVAGYFSSADEYLPIIHPYSNGHEMFMLSMDGNGLKNEYTYSVLAHEFQHMIHWYGDRNEEIWLNEGSSDLAVFLNGYSTGGHDRVFAQAPDIQLNEWPNNDTSKADHYGASFLFMTYFLDRFGEQATKALVADPENGMVSIDNVLAQLQIKDPVNGRLINADSFFLDWLIANFLQDKKVADGRYTYHNYPGAPDFGPTQEITRCPVDDPVHSVHQYGVNYVAIRCKGDKTIRFSGSTQVSILPVNPHSGSYAFYSNRGNESDMTLTREFDFSNISGALTLSYWTWFDLEKDYDFLYLLASEDGEKWQILATPAGSADNPTGNSYGWAYTGTSGEDTQWIPQEVDLSQFAGKKVQLRFEYITDEAVNGEGFLLDDLTVKEIGYSTDFETDDGGWVPNGFVRIQNVLPQTFQLALIEFGRDTNVQIISVPSTNQIEIPITIGNGTDKAVLVVAGTSRFTRQRAVYSIEIDAR